MSPGEALRTWWRVVAVGLLGGIIAFTGSLALSDTYAAGTRLLIRGREATFLTDSAQNVANQPGIVDASFAKALGKTQAGVVTSREMAIAIVDKLGLDKRPLPKRGLLAKTAAQVVTVYANSKAFVKHGFYRKPSRREKAITEVQEGLMAAPLEDSYILEVVGSGETPELARDITDAAADELVAISRRRASADAARYEVFLREELAQARAAVDAAAAAISTFKTENNLTGVDTQVMLDQVDADDLRKRINDTSVSLAGAEAQLRSLNASIAKLAPRQSGEQTIKTGRSETKIVSDQPSTLQQQLIAQRDSTVARVAELKAQDVTLKSRLNGTAATLNAEQAQLVQLDQQLSIAKAQQADVSARHAEARANVTEPRAELTRIDRAFTPLYPIGPKRYLFLALGLLLGSLAGWALTRMSMRARVPALAGGAREGRGLGDVVREPAGEWLPAFPLGTAQVPATVSSQVSAQMSTHQPPEGT